MSTTPKIKNQKPEVKKPTPAPAADNKLSAKETMVNSITDDQLIKLSKEGKIINISQLSNELRKKVQFFDNRQKDTLHYLVRASSNSKIKGEFIAKITSAKQDNRVNDYYCTMQTFLEQDGAIKKFPIHKLTANFLRPATEKEIKAFENLAQKYKMMNLETAAV